MMLEGVLACARQLPSREPAATRCTTRAAEFSAAPLPSTRKLRRGEGVVRSLLHIRLDGGDSVVLRVFVRGDATLFDRRQDLLEVVLGEGEVGHG